MRYKLACALVRDTFFGGEVQHRDSDKAAKIDAARISARWNLRLQPIPWKWKNVREVLFGGAMLYRHPPIGTHLFLLIAKLRDGVTVNMTDGCATMESPRAVRTNEPHGRTPKISRHAATARFRGWTSRGKSRDWEGLTFDVESIYLPACVREQTVSIFGHNREEMAKTLKFSLVIWFIVIAS